MTTNVEYKKSVFNDLKLIGMPESKRILNKLEKDLGKDPDKGTPLKGELKGLYRIRIRDYRVIYTKTKEGVLVLKVGHRSTHRKSDI